jgi:hypothetical protein
MENVVVVLTPDQEVSLSEVSANQFEGSGNVAVAAQYQPHGFDRYQDQMTFTVAGQGATQAAPLEVTEEDDGSFDVAFQFQYSRPGNVGDDVRNVNVRGVAGQRVAFVQGPLANVPIEFYQNVPDPGMDHLLWATTTDNSGSVVVNSHLRNGIYKARVQNGGVWSAYYECDWATAFTVFVNVGQ